METANPLAPGSFCLPLYTFENWWNMFSEVKERKAMLVFLINVHDYVKIYRNFIQSLIFNQCTVHMSGENDKQTLMTCINSHHGQTMLVDWPLFWVLYRLQDYWHLLTVTRTYRKYKVPLIQNLKWVSIQLLMVTRAGTYWQHTGASKPRTSAPINLKH